ncbi:MAG: hypothetical protein J0I06_17990 [Planctomycetes bacterium]|nr:hypothetical protein [Planctomycetota bacterium]
MTESPLERLARRASAEPSFLGWQLAAFARARGFDDDALAAYLGCVREVLANVRLCGAIRPDRFREDVACVAQKFGLDARRLADAAKRLPAEPVREPARADAPGVCIAARDRGEAP